MSTSIESSSGHFLNQSANSLSDEEWIKSLRFRNSVSTDLKAIAEAGQVEQFSKAVQRSGDTHDSMKKPVRKILSDQLSLLMDMVNPSDDLTSVLVDSDLKKAERSVRVEAFIAENSDETPEGHTLCKALWILMIYRGKLSTDAYFSLWRWTLQHGQEWIEHHQICDPEQGLSQLRSLEVCLMMATTFPDLQDSRSLQKESIQLLRNCVDESTDNDGTPHAIWIPGIITYLKILARLTLFAKTNRVKLWNSEFRTRVDGLLNRSATLIAGSHVSFVSDNEPQYYRVLPAIADALSGKESDLANFWSLHTKRKPVSSRKINAWALPEEVHQSDWAMLACLRSGWQSPVDRCAILFDSSVPQLDLVVAETPLFQGLWSHEFTVDDQRIETNEAWDCSCWFADSEVNFIEFVQKIDTTTKIVRQLAFLKEQHLLLMNHFVHCKDSAKLELLTKLPFNGTWELEQDSATREFALQSSTSENSSPPRIRLFPLSLEQDLVTKASGSVNADEKCLSLNQKSDGQKLVSSMILDWSPQRMHKAVDWSRLTVAQDGQIESNDSAIAFRCRIGRDQWLFYHSLADPDLPRTVMGLHTPHETVLSKFSSKGEIVPIVEVEML